jgi:hypothetical protein
MWNIKKAEEPEEAVAIPSSSSSRYMNPYEITKNELMKKLKFFAVYLSGIVVVPTILRSLGVLEPLGVPLTRR